MRGRLRWTLKVSTKTGLAASVAGLWAARSEAAPDPCQAFYGKGYCTDYVNGRISPRQAGDGDSWPSNMPGDDIYCVRDRVKADAISRRIPARGPWRG